MRIGLRVHRGERNLPVMRFGGRSRPARLSPSDVAELPSYEGFLVCRSRINRATMAFQIGVRALVLRRSMFPLMISLVPVSSAPRRLPIQSDGMASNASRIACYILFVV